MICLSRILEIYLNYWKTLISTAFYIQWQYGYQIITYNHLG